MNANAWMLLMSEEGTGQRTAKKAMKNLVGEVPVGLFTHLTGLTITIGGMPVDLGLPANININAARKHGLLDR